METEYKHIKSFDWKQFFRIAGSMTLLGVGAIVAKLSEGEPIQAIIGVALMSIGIALNFTE